MDGPGRKREAFRMLPNFWLRKLQKQLSLLGHVVFIDGNGSYETG